MTRKFKVGDRVRVRQWEDMEREFGLDNSGFIKVLLAFNPEMRELCGKCATIEDTDDEGRIILCDIEAVDSLNWDWHFSHDMFEEVKPMSKSAEPNDEINYRFFYCESEDSYLLGYRVDNFYYAKWDKSANCFCWCMSRYLPWGETKNGYTYPSEPVEIGPSEWFDGFLKQRGITKGESKPMSKLAEYLGVEEGQEFTVDGGNVRYKINNGIRMHFDTECGHWLSCDTEEYLAHIINHPEKIKIIQPKPELSEDTKAKLRALRVVWPEHCWVAADFNGCVFIYVDRPELHGSVYEATAAHVHINVLGGEITHDMGPVYYGEL